VQSCQVPHKFFRLEVCSVYQALYRKWRPRTFDDVVGQSHITETLKNQVASDRLSHAYLFIGTRGTGKTTCAKILAKAVNCEHPVNGNPCNECRICRGIDDGSIMDVMEMDAASNNGVDNVRQLRDEAIFSPATAKKRVYIIDEVHMLSTSAFNALLKILEEPPAHLMFILATTELNKVPATILSRCQRHSFKRLDTDSIIDRLLYVAGEERLALTSDAAALIAGLSEGGMRDALSMLDQCSGREKIDVDTVYSAMGLAGNREIAEMLRLMAAHSTAEVIGLFSRLWQGGKDPSTLLGELSTLMRDILMRTVAPKGGRELLSGGYDDALLEEFRSAFSAASLVYRIGVIQKALADMRAGQAKTVCELCLITLCEPELDDSAPALCARIEQLESALRSGNIPAAGASAARCAEVAKPASDSSEPMNDEVPFDLPPEPRQVEPTPQIIDVAQTEDAEVPSYAEPCAAGDDFWTKMLADIDRVFAPGDAVMFADRNIVNGALSGDVLVIRLQQFAKNMLDKPENIQKLSAIAAKNRRAATQVKFELADEGTAPAENAVSKLDQLSRFGVVKFK